MKNKLMNKLKKSMKPFLNENQQNILEDTVNDLFKDFDVIKIDKTLSLEESNNNYLLILSIAFNYNKHILIFLTL